MEIVSDDLRKALQDILDVARDAHATCRLKRVVEIAEAAIERARAMQMGK